MQEGSREQRDGKGREGLGEGKGRRDGEGTEGRVRRGREGRREGEGRKLRRFVRH